MATLKELLETSDLGKPYALERFTTGALIDEHGAAAVAH